MQVDKRIEPYINQALKVDFIKEHWEFEQYVTALVLAAEWGASIDKQNKEYFKKNHLIDKYNV